MDKNEKHTKLLEIFNDYAGNEGWRLDCNLKNDIGLNSLDLVEIVVEIEEAFQITISEEMQDKIETVADVFSFAGA
ncbi:MAG: acyl carrier protein [Bacteroidetes bacterium]|nr:acyl carrier protein [Bacteroidota bacterium]